MDGLDKGGGGGEGEKGHSLNWHSKVSRCRHRRGGSTIGGEGTNQAQQEVSPGYHEVGYRR